MYNIERFTWPILLACSDFVDLAIFVLLRVCTGCFILTRCFLFVTQLYLLWRLTLWWQCQRGGYCPRYVTSWRAGQAQEYIECRTHSTQMRCNTECHRKSFLPVVIRLFISPLRLSDTLSQWTGPWTPTLSAAKIPSFIHNLYLVLCNADLTMQ